MEKTPTTFAADEERLAAIARTVKEQSAYEDVDVRSIVIKAMDAYSAKQMEELGNEEEYSSTTADSYIQFISQTSNRFHELVMDSFAVIVPGLLYLGILYFIVHEIGRWDMPLPLRLMYLFIGIPAGLGIALGIVSIPKGEYKSSPLGIINDTLRRFMGRIRVGGIVSGLIMTSILTWALIRAFNARRENNAIAYNSSKVMLTDKSFSTLKDLQVSADSIRPENKSTEWPLSTDKSIELETVKDPQSKRISYTIKGKDSFPGNLRAEIDPVSVTVYWTKNNELISEPQTQIYVCSIKEILGDNIVLEPLGSDTTAVISKAAEADSPTISLLLDGQLIKLKAGGNSINPDDLSKGESIILAYDVKTKNIIMVEKLPPSHHAANLPFRPEQDVEGSKGGMINTSYDSFYAKFK